MLAESISGRLLTAQSGFFFLVLIQSALSFLSKFQLLMKTVISLAAILTLSTSASFAVVSFSGAIGTSFKMSDNLANIPSGSHWMIVVDQGQPGFLAQSTYGALTSGVTSLIGANDPLVSDVDASINIGGYFGGDLILATGASGTSGVISISLNNLSIAGLEFKSFALIWFEKNSSTLTNEGLFGQKYGILRASDWVLPPSDFGAYTFSATDAGGSAGYFSVSTSAISSAQIGSTGFFTGSGTAGDAASDIKATAFTIVPEPTTLLTAVSGILVFFRRRRS